MTSPSQATKASMHSEYQSAVCGLVGWMGARLGGFLKTALTKIDECFQASIARKVAVSSIDTGRRLIDGSMIGKAVTPLALMAIRPFGQQVTVETALGLVLAAAAVAPTEIVFVIALAATTLMVRDRARLAEKARDTSGWWVIPDVWLLIPLFGVFLFVIGATFSSPVFGASLYNMVIWCFYGLLFAVATEAAYRGKSSQVIWPFLTGATFSGLVAMYQKVTGWQPPRSWLDTKFEEDIVRVVGTFSNPTFLAEFLALALTLTLVLMLQKRDWQNRLLLLGYAGVQSLALILTSSRGAWLGFAVSFAVVAVLYDRRLLLVGLLAAVLLFALAPPFIFERLLSSFSFSDSSNSYRIFIWRGSVALAKAYLLRGVGLGAGAFAHIYPEYMIIQTPAPHAHCNYLQILIELGVFGFAVLMWFFFAWTYKALRTVLRAKGSHSVRWAQIGITAGVLAAFLGQMLHGLIEYTWYNPRITVVFWAFLGIGEGLMLRQKEEMTAIESSSHNN